MKRKKEFLYRSQKTRKNFERNIPRIHHKILFVENSKEEIKQASVSKYNSKCVQRKSYFGKKCYYFAVKMLSA